MEWLSVHEMKTVNGAGGTSAAENIWIEERKCNKGTEKIEWRIAS
jgi:hypothetical protein